MARTQNLRTAAWSHWNHSPFVLYAAVMLFTIHMCMVGVILPWRIMELGGDRLAVGALGLWFVPYILGCLWIGPRADRLGVKHLLLVATGSNAAIVSLMPQASSVPVLLATYILTGLTTSLFWAPMVGWLSTGHDGPHLNRRLGAFNFSWGTGAILGYPIGSALETFAKVHPGQAFYVPAGLVAVTMILIAGARHLPGQVRAGSAPRHDEPVDPVLQRTFCWISRIALVFAWLSLGALRFPLASLVKEISRQESTRLLVYALAICTSNSVQTAVYFLLGKTSRWHYRLTPLVLLQLSAAVAVAGVGLSTGPIELIFWCAAATTGLAVSYHSHIYYSLDVGTSRSAGMAFHEIIAAAGFAAGSFVVGGALGQAFGIRTTYHVAAACLVGSVLAQLLLYRLCRPRRPARVLSTSARNP